MPRPQFSIRTMLWLTLVVALLSGIGLVLAGMRDAAIERANRHRPAAKTQAR
jgi:hypothetical protein